jgi:hypothetical protein
MVMPLSLEEALQSVYAPQWQEACNKEVGGLEAQGVWEEVEYNKKTIPHLIGLKASLC